MVLDVANKGDREHKNNKFFVVIGVGRESA